MINNLPEPNCDEQAHTALLQRKIREVIEQHGGRIPFEKFMQMALYDLEHGYYRSASRKFGVGGDFVTAPELSPLFSWSVARQLEQVLRAVQNPCILELGAGSGVMALEILRELERRHCPVQHYFILEVSGELRLQQKALFLQQAPEYLDKVVWLDRWPETPLSGVILANEVLDAMPVHKIKIENGVKEFFVGYAHGHFNWQVAPPSNPTLVTAVETLGVPLSEGYSTEFNLLVQPWINSLAQSLQQGLILLIDYGYVRSEFFHPERSMGTLMCHYKQRAHDNPLVLPGIQDITAHVDFTSVALAADAATLEVAGFTHQAAFLVNCGLMEFYHEAKDPYAVSQPIKRLTLPSEMGERFKVIALTKAFDEALLGFSQFDQLERL